MSVGLISDTHGLLRPEALRSLAGSDHIIHAGDVGDPGVLEALAMLAPVTAVRGNNDREAWARALPERAVLRVGGVAIYVIHDVLDLDAARLRGMQAVVAGHSHKPSAREREGVLYVNPGSAGPRRFRLPITVGRLEIAGGTLQAELVELAVPR